MIGFGTGIGLWFALGHPGQWLAVMCFAGALAAAGFAARAGRLERAAGWFGLAVLLGCSWVWARSQLVAQPRLERPRVVTFSARVESVEPLIARGDVRLLLSPADPTLPPRVRVSTKAETAPAGVAAGAELTIRARLAPPPPMALPGTHDFARDAWFRGIGAVGRTLGPVTVTQPERAQGVAAARERLGRHVRERLPGPPGTIAATLATGDKSAISEADAEAMRRSGLAHLLAVSGLHIAAVVGLAMLVTLRLFALSEWLALRCNLMLVAAGAGALAGIGYTVLTGMQVPTVRSCIAALLVLAGIALGRDAISLRLVAVGALIVLVVRPEVLPTPSFQFSFAAVTAIVTLHASPWARRHLQRRDEHVLLRWGRGLAALAATGLAVELALTPLALYHFHKAGLYSVAANLIAIPLTTLVIMPLEAGALLLDLVGLGKPLWWLCGLALGLLLDLAHAVSNARGAVAMLPSMPVWALALMVVGGLWLCLWTTRIRLLGLGPIALGAAAAVQSPTPDILVTGDGRHVAVVEQGVPLLLRDRAGDYVRSLFAETAGFDGDPEALAGQRRTDCSRDACTTVVRKGRSEWRLLATRSSTRIEWTELTSACAQADIVVSDRFLPRGCVPRWLKLDAPALRRTGGLAIYLGDQPRVDTVAERIGRHPWRM
ncbi:MAG TPA: ComEC/Rec2 family competence protein [Sphingomicrobium sp.]|nr:ComEC/Rec2 family competence protein [Sphingomicrobium sp.]